MSFRIIISLAALCCLASAGVAFAEEPALTTSQDVAYVSKYVCRGLPSNSEGAIQPSITVSHTNGVSFNIWGSMDTTDFAGNSGRLTELDYTLDYTWESAGRPVNAGIIHYTFPNTDFTSTSELYASMCFGGALAPSIGLNYDFKEADGYYLTFGGEYNCSVPWDKTSAQKMSISAGLGLGSSGYNKFYFYGADKTALNDLTVGITLPLQMNDKLVIEPSIGYSRVISGKLRSALESEDLKPDNLFAGLTVSFEL